MKNHDGFGVLIFAFKSKASLYFVAALVNALNFSKELALAKCKNPDFRNLLCQDKTFIQTNIVPRISGINFGC